MQHIEIYGFAPSTYVRTARMVCEEKHVDYQLKPLEFGEESHRALHPYLRMPVMRAGKLMLYETLAIASYIDNTFEGPRLEPDQAEGHARMLQWISAFNDYLYTDLVRALLKSENPADADLTAARRDLEIVDRQLLAGPFLLGKEIYLCDLFLAPMIAFAEQAVSDRKLFKKLDGLAAWRDKIGSRASFKATQP